MVAPVPDDPDVGSVAVPLVPGVDVHCAMPELDGAVEVGIQHEDEVLERELVAPKDPGKHFHLEIGPLAADLALEVDNSRGKVHASGRVSAGNSDSGKDRTIAELDTVVLRYAPAHGFVGERAEPDPPVFEHPQFGESRMSSKNVTRFFVEERERALANVGKVVKKALWDDYPDWVFNTVACVGSFDAAGRGSYSDPTSVWFNVFVGYYQIDAPKPDWERPFAYESAGGPGAEIRFEDIVRLGKSDWGYFSNWMYGVPEQIVERHDAIDMSRLETSQADAGVIGSSVWHRARIGGVDFVSAYEADHRGAERLVKNSPLSPLWREAFGPPNPQPQFEQSFIGTTFDADLYIAYWEDDDAFHTVMFGGTAASDSPPAFLDGQLEAAKRVIERGYPTLGFKAE